MSCIAARRKQCDHVKCAAGNFLCCGSDLALVTTTSGQDSAPSTPLTLVSRDARRTIPTSVQNGREVVALDISPRCFS